MGAETLRTGIISLMEKYKQKDKKTNQTIKPTKNFNKNNQKSAVDEIRDNPIGLPEDKEQNKDEGTKTKKHQMTKETSTIEERTKATKENEINLKEIEKIKEWKRECDKNHGEIMQKLETISLQIAAINEKAEDLKANHIMSSGNIVQGNRQSTSCISYEVARELRRNKEEIKKDVLVNTEILDNRIKNLIPTILQVMGIEDKEMVKLHKEIMISFNNKDYIKKKEIEERAQLRLEERYNQLDQEKEMVIKGAMNNRIQTNGGNVIRKAIETKKGWDKSKPEQKITKGKDRNKTIFKGAKGWHKQTPERQKEKEGEVKGEETQPTNINGIETKQEVKTPDKKEEKGENTASASDNSVTRIERPEDKKLQLEIEDIQKHKGQEKKKKEIEDGLREEKGSVTFIRNNVTENWKIEPKE